MANRDANSGKTLQEWSEEVRDGLSGIWQRIKDNNPFEAIPDGIASVRKSNNLAEVTGNKKPSSGEIIMNELFPGSKTFMNRVDNVIDDMLYEDKPIDEAVAEELQNHSSPSNGSSAKPIVYSNWSPAAQQFGMSQETAYAEHMANTAHQREVADLKAAGLNPVLGVSGSGSGSVSGSVAGVSSGKKIEEGNSLVDLIGATAAVVASVATKNPMYGFMISNALKTLK